MFLNRYSQRHEAGHAVEALLRIALEKSAPAHMGKRGKELASVANKEFLSLMIACQNGDYFNPASLARMMA